METMLIAALPKGHDRSAGEECAGFIAAIGVRRFDARRGRAIEPRGANCRMTPTGRAAGDRD